MKWLNDKELQSGKYDWVGGGRDGLNEFRGKIQDELAMIDSEITLILENELGKVEGREIGKKINQLLNFLKNEAQLKEFTDKDPNFPLNLKLLNKVRVFAAHGDSCINAKSGEEVVLIMETSGSRDGGLLFDENLAKETEDLFNRCHMFILNMQIELGYYDNELEL